MNILRQKNFDRQFTKLRPAQKQLAIRRIQQFVVNPFDPQLRNHALKGKWIGHRSISVGGDIRIHYKDVGNNDILLVAIGTHSQLYK